VSVSRPVRPATVFGLPPGYELFNVALSIFSIGNVVIVLGPFDAETKAVALIVDGFLSLIFLADFFLRLSRSHPRRVYFVDHQGWLDLLGSMPLPLFRLFRLVRIVKAIRRVRAMGGPRVVRAIIRERAQSALLLATFLVIVIVELGSILVIVAERGAPNANITTGGDALWWSIVSVTTVGYGDKFPVTALGRLIGSLMLITGVGLFGVFTGYVARVFLTPRAEDDAGAAELAALEQVEDE
jgi:voltage-gated potassium channel